MLEKESGVLVALPHGDTGQVEVWSNKRGALTKNSVKKIIEINKDFKVIGFRRQRADETGRSTRTCVGRSSAPCGFS